MVFKSGKEEVKKNSKASWLNLRQPIRGQVLGENSVDYFLDFHLERVFLLLVVDLNFFGILIF